MKNNTLRIALCGALITMAGYSANAQNKELKVGTNPTIKQPSAVFEVESANKGMLLPRVALTSLTDVTTIANPADALTVFNTAFNGMAPNNVIPGYYYWSAADSKWIRLMDKEPVQDLRFVGTSNHVTQDAGVNENGTSLGSGQDNIAIGRSAMRFIAAGSRNIAIGSSLGDLENGNDNIVIGNNSGGYLQNESNNIIIGNSMASLNGTDNFGNYMGLSNSLRIGDFLYGSKDVNTNKTKIAFGGDYFYNSPTDNIFKETLSIASGGLWIKDINSAAYTSADAADKIVVADANGVLKSKDASALSVEPWQIQGTADKATDNAQNIYQTGSVAIGKNAVQTGAALDVAGAVRGGAAHTGTVGANSVAFGENNTVSAENAGAIGKNNVVSASGALALGENNNVSGFNSAIAGGIGNTVIGWFSNIGGGTDNVISAGGNRATIAGGQNNTANGMNSTVGGGQNNIAGNLSNPSIYNATVAGGGSNTASGMNSTVGGGSGNTANGVGATVVGGNNNTASGFASVAAGGINNISPAYGGFVAGTNNAIVTGGTVSATDALFQVGNGDVPTSTRNNALTILRNANTGIGINGTEAAAKPTELLDLGGTAAAGSGGLKIRNINSAAYTSADAADKIVVADANGVLKSKDASALSVEPWFNQNAVGTQATANTQKIYQMGNVAIGKVQGATGAALDVEGAVRGGTLSADELSGASTIGTNSATFGTGNIASGTNAIAAGKLNKATGESAVAMGGAEIEVVDIDSDYLPFTASEPNIASGKAATAFGSNTEASGDGATAFGLRTYSRALGSTTWGAETRTTGQLSTVWGFANLGVTGYLSTVWGLRHIAVSGKGATVWGDSNTAVGRFATVFGLRNEGAGVFSTTWGNNNKAVSIYETSFGSGNAITTGTANSWVATDALMQVGKSPIGARSNALTILKNGKTGIGIVGTEAAAKPTELLDLGGAATATNGGLRIRNINSAAYTSAVATDKIVVADADGVLKTKDASALVPNIITNNGITKNATTNEIELGGTLNRATAITTSATHTLALNGIGSVGEDEFYNEGYAILGLNPNNNVVVQVEAGELFEAGIKTNNGISKHPGTNEIELGGTLNRATVITTGGSAQPTHTLAIAGLQPSTNAADKLVVTDANGVLKTATAAAPQFFYTPSLVLPTTSTDLPSYVTFAGGTFTVDLHAVYANQFGMTGNVAGSTRSAIKSASATTLPVIAANALEYFVTYFDNTVFDPNSITLSDAGVLTYQVLGTATVSEKTYMNIVFKMK